MKHILILMGGVISAVTCLIPIINGSDVYSILEVVMHATGLTVGAALGLLSYSIDYKTNKYWFIALPISVLLLFYSLVYVYDNFIDIHNQVKTYHYAFIIFLTTFITLIICSLIKYRQQRQLT